MSQSTQCPGSIVPLEMFELILDTETSDLCQENEFFLQIFFQQALIKCKYYLR